MVAARFAIDCRREAERHVASLRRCLGVSPLVLRELFSLDPRADDLEPFGRALGPAVLG